MASKKSASREDPQKYVLKKNFKKAIAIYLAIIEDNPEDANPHLRLGDCYVSDSQVAPAIEIYKVAAKLFGDQGFLLKAIGVNKKIVKLDPSQEQVHENLSKLYEERGLLAAPGGSSVESAVPAAKAAAPGDVDMGLEALDDEEEIVLGEMPASSSADSPAAVDTGEPGLDELLGSMEETAALTSGSELSTGAVPVPELSTGAIPVPEDSADDAGLSVDELGDALSDELPAAAGAVDAGRTPLFSDFTANELVEVIKRMGQETFAGDSVIVTEGDKGDSLFVLVSGSVRVLTTARGKELKLADLSEGAFFGEGSLLTGKPRTATIIANEDSELLTLDRPGLDEIVKTHPRVRDVMMSFYQARAENTVKAILGSKK